ncbi:unnamed protein product [Closterium sp. Yama58-4]|nr:unnamed protein product [Closterium sp. Yama58-4]
MTALLSTPISTQLYLTQPHPTLPHSTPTHSIPPHQPDVVVNCAAVSVPRQCESDPALAMRPLCFSASPSLSMLHFPLPPSLSHQPDVVVNCAAVSVPRQCESDPDLAMRINVPSALIAALSDAAGKPAGSSATGDGHGDGIGVGSGSKEGLEGLERDKEQLRLPLLIHLSTDQVYEGAKSFYKEDDPLLPVNTYGRSKVAGEQAVRHQWQGSHAILRSSIIVGPPPPVPLKKTLPLQWMDGALRAALASGQPESFFDDEYRCPIYVHDYSRIVRALMHRHAQGQRVALTLNVGGPDRLSRADMAAVVARVRGYLVPASTPTAADGGAVDDSAAAAAADCAGTATSGDGGGGVRRSASSESDLIIRVPAASMANRGVASPPDISMNTQLIQRELSLSLTPFEQAVQLTFAAAQ